MRTKEEIIVKIEELLVEYIVLDMQLSQYEDCSCDEYLALENRLYVVEDQIELLQWVLNQEPNNNTQQNDVETYGEHYVVNHSNQWPVEIPTWDIETINIKIL